jgi:hypothetical protein
VHAATASTSIIEVNPVQRIRGSTLRIHEGDERKPWREERCEVRGGERCEKCVREVRREEEREQGKRGVR